MATSIDELAAWADRWEAIRADAYDSLTASYTVEQRELLHRMNHAAVQKRLCYARMKWPAGSTSRKPAHMISWPEEPPK